MMGVWQPVNNLRDYISQNPPVVTFFLCLSIVAVSFICLSSYTYTHTLPNPDTTKDWNYLLSSLSHLKLCVKANVSSAESASPVPSPQTEQEVDRATTVVASTKTPPSITSLRVKVPLVLSSSSGPGSVTDLELFTTLNASQLHLGGNESISLTLDITSESSNYTCLTIKAPTHILPLDLLPPECPASEKEVSRLHVEAAEHQAAESQTCYSLRSQHDPTLTVMLTQAERRVAVRRLLEVSVFLLAVCLLMCLSASLSPSTTRRNHWNNGLDLQNEPLMDP